MSARSIGQGCVKLRTNDKMTAMSHEQNSGKCVEGTRMRFTGNCSAFRLPKRSELSPLKYMKRIGHKMARLLRSVSPRKRASRKVSSSEKAVPLPCAAAAVDSHRAEAIDDCIEFINTSASLPRSNSVSC